MGVDLRKHIGVSLLGDAERPGETPSVVDGINTPGRGTTSIPFMVDDDRADTEAAAPPTEQAPAEPVVRLTAWSAEPDFGDALPDGGRSWSSAAGIAALIVVLGGVVAVLVWLVGRPALHTVIAREMAPPSSSVTVTVAPPETVVETTVVTVSPDPPPSIETVAAPVPTPAIVQPVPAAGLSDYDRQFIGQLQSEGWTVSDPGMVARNANRVCLLFRQGATPEYVNAKLAADTGMNMTEAYLFTSAAMLTYPNCA